MPGLEPGIHVELRLHNSHGDSRLRRRMDCRTKSGNDDLKIRISLPLGPG
jgi:hypothetical protein